ncbi:MAG: Gfo/Idh/MocA family oxidoreductase [Deltaproteobacteria bacterium]|nr:Gfo/Idh/MocA family oxidoreductase [Deltaproteobacteria bacterium]
MRYRACVIGCGRVAWLLEDDPLETRPCTHMGAYTALSHRVKVIGAADVNNERLISFGKRFGVKSMYLDYKEMLKEVSPDIVSVCAYAPDRSGMVMDSIEAGVKGIWCEKAFSASLEEARAMRNACSSNGVSLIVSHMRRWSGDYRKAKEIIDSGGIGKLQSIICHFSGSLLHTGTHAFDILNWFCGPAEWVEGRVENRPGNSAWDTDEDLGGRAVIHFRNGSYAMVSAESKNYFFFEFDVIGASGRIRIGNNDVLEYYRPGASAHYTGIKELQEVPFPYFEKKNIWVEALGNLIDSVEGSGRPADGPEEGLSSLELALAIHSSARQNGARVYLPINNDITVRSR